MSTTDPHPEGTDAARRPRWPLVVLAVLAVAAVGFAVGRFTMFDSSAAPAVPNAADIGFARDMQAHHAQAVEMAMTIFRGTEDDEIRALSYDIATGQSAGRGEMYDWLVQWGVPQSGDPMTWMAASDAHAGHAAGAPSDEELRVQMGMASDQELARLAAASGTEADCLFLELMIRHHAGAIPMADAVLELGSAPRVLQVAQSMKDGQTAEIDAMTAAQARLGCAP